MEEKEIEIKIFQIKVLSFSFIHKDSLESPKINEDEINFTYKSNIGLKVNKETEVIDIKFSLKVYIPKKKEEIINLEVLSSYLFKDIKDFEVSAEEVEIPEEIIENLILTSISNSRGVLAVKVNETGFKNVILPLIQMDELIPKEAKKQKNKKEI